MTALDLKRFRRLVLCVLLLCAVLSAVRAETTETAKPGKNEITSLDDLDGADIGVQTGMICDVLTQQRIPNTKIQYYNSQTDAMVDDIRNGRITLPTPGPFIP